jgi:glycosyltransferase involved in cell wall biosynthesis
VGDSVRLNVPVTVVIPVRHDDANLAACLQPLYDRVDRVIVADSDWIDSTADIARQAGADYVVFQWNGRFPKKRNWVLQSQGIATPWVLFLDADERVSTEFLAALARELPASRHDGYWLRYTNHFLGSKLRYGPPMRKLALVRVGAGGYERIDEDCWSGLDMEVHEHPVLTGSTGEISIPIEHNDYKGLHAYIQRHNEYSSWEAARYATLANSPESWQAFTPAQQRKYRGLAKWWLAPAYFFYSYIWKLGFLDGGAGFAFAFLKAVYFFQIRLKIRERQLSCGR